MKKSLLIAMAFFGMILATTTPASAQVYVQAGPVGVEIGNPYVYAYNYPVCYDQYGYAYNCNTYPYVYLNGWWGGRYFAHGYWDRRYYYQGGRYFGPGVRGGQRFYNGGQRFYNGAPHFEGNRNFGGHLNGGQHFSGGHGGHR